MWWIIAPSSNRDIMFQFESIDLPFSKNCTDTDHVVISEKIPHELAGKNFGMLRIEYFMKLS